MTAMRTQCPGCGACCSSLLPVSDGEIKRIRKYIRKHNITPSQHLTETKCPFLDITKSKDKCMIYEVRPWICRVFSCSKMVVDPKDLHQLRYVVDMQIAFRPEKK